MKLIKVEKVDNETFKEVVRRIVSPVDREKYTL